MDWGVGILGFCYGIESGMGWDGVVIIGLGVLVLDMVKPVSPTKYWRMARPVFLSEFGMGLR